MLEVRGVSKKFTKKNEDGKNISFFADDNISFKVDKGSILGILGPNGAGKTTLLRIIAGIMEPTIGDVSIDDMNYRDNSIDIKKRVAYLSGNTKLYKTG